MQTNIVIKIDMILIRKYLCTKNERVIEKEKERQTDRQTESEKDKKTDRQKAVRGREKEYGKWEGGRRLKSSKKKKQLVTSYIRQIKINRETKTR